MKRRSGWIAAALLGAGLLFALTIGQSVRADSHEGTPSESDAVEPLEQVAEDTADETAGKGKAKAGKKRGGRDRGAAARGNKAKRKRARSAERAAKRQAGERAEAGGEAVREGGQAREHRSERAAERANSQWREGATRGRERAESVRGAGGESAEGELKDLDAEASGAARGEPERDSRGRRGKGEPPEEAKGFWSRFFGFGGEGEE
jgi:hypothetical protein